jgi:hypothetical protein
MDSTKSCYDQRTAAQGQSGVIDMQTFFAHPAVGRRYALFAGMLMAKVMKDGTSETPPPKGDDLVSWCSGARSRREDELARQHLTELE